MDKRGFVFVETIVAIVILTSSLLLLYSTFTNILQSEKTRIYYDDINYIYRTNYLKKVLYKEDLASILSELLDRNDNTYLTLVGPDNFSDPATKNFINRFYNDFEIKTVYFIKKNKINDLKECSNTCVTNGTGTNCTVKNRANCKELYKNSDEFINYVKTIYVNLDVVSDYLLVAEFDSCDKNNFCRSYFSWVSVNL